MKTCKCLDLSGEVPWGNLQECGKLAAIEFVYEFADRPCACSDRTCPLHATARTGTTPMCLEHYEERYEDGIWPDPDNLVPVDEQWRKL